MGELRQPAIDVRSWVRSESRLPAGRAPRPSKIAPIVAMLALVAGLVLVLADPFAEVPIAEQLARTETPNTPTGPRATGLPEPELADVGALTAAGLQLVPISEDAQWLGGPGELGTHRGKAHGSKPTTAATQVVTVEIPCVLPDQQGCRVPRPSSPFPGTGRTIGALLSLGALAFARLLRSLALT